MAATADLIVANRAYLDHENPGEDAEQGLTAHGGLLTAIRPVIAPWDGIGQGTTWVGAGRGAYDTEWVDEAGHELLETERGMLRHRRVFFDGATWNAHYNAVANSFFWPLLHLVRDPLPERAISYPRPLTPSPEEWDAHHRANRDFAEAAWEERRTGTAWIHDYQLALTPDMLREKGYRGQIGFFLHTPFPDLWVASRYLDARALDYFRAFIAGMLGSNLIGFQSHADVARFTEAAIRLVGASRISGGLLYRSRVIRLGAHPVGIDADGLVQTARHGQPPARYLPILQSGLPVVVALERGDFTKGIPERLRAVAAAYRQGAKFAYIGASAPTREGISAYGEFSEAVIETTHEAATIAAETGNPFIQEQAAIPWPEVVALQREADVIFTSSLADGLNLVPLQAAIAQSLRPAHRRAVVLTGRDAGVARALAGFELDGLVPVDPLNLETTTETLIAALKGNPGRVSDRLIAEIRKNDARAWATGFLSALEA